MTLLPNMRLLGLPSAAQGRDWDKLTKSIDLKIEEENFDLAEETILLKFQGNDTSVFRPVIGGRRELASPWLLEDRVAGQVELIPVEGNHWEDILDQVAGLRKKLIQSGQKLQEGFTLLLKRRLNPDLRLSVEVFFSFF